MNVTNVTKPLRTYLPLVLIAAVFMCGCAQAFGPGLHEPQIHEAGDNSRGMYFYKKTYIPEPLPQFEESKAQLPMPIIDSHPEWIELYWAAWKMAFDHVKAPSQGSPLVSNFLDAAFSSHIFQWDTIFMLQFGEYANPVFPAVQSLDNFYARQHADGYIDREIVAATGADWTYVSENDTINPPLFAWAEVRHAHFSGDLSRYPQIYLPLIEYADFLETARHALHSKHQLYFNSGLGSGMDNAPRGGTGWVDMSSQMVIMYQSLEEIALALGRNDDAQKFKDRADAIAQKIQKFMWDEHDGLYYDVDDDGAFVKHKTLACFWPMLAHIATPAQVTRLIGHLSDPKTYWRMNPWPSLAADEPEYTPDGRYWQGGVWAPTNAMITEGLKNYVDVPGAQALIVEASQRYIENISTVFGQTNTIWEFYKPDSAEPGLLWWFIQGHKDFVGWSGIGPIQFLIENILGFHTEGLKNQVTWTVNRADHHGIKGLRVGTATVSLEAEALTKSYNAEFASLVIHAVSDQPVTLVILWNGSRIEKRLLPGEQTFLAQAQ